MTQPAVPPPLPFPAPGGPHPVRGPGAFRVGDAERQQVCDQLARHFEQGRLDAVELEERLEAAVLARTGADLWRLTHDLPGPDPASPSGWARPHRRPGRSALTALAWLTALSTTAICLLMVLGSGLLFGGTGWAVAALFGGVLAATGGVAIGHLLHVHLGSAAGRATDQPPASRRASSPWAK